MTGTQKYTALHTYHEHWGVRLGGVSKSAYCINLLTVLLISPSTTYPTPTSTAMLCCLLLLTVLHAVRSVDIRGSKSSNVQDKVIERIDLISEAISNAKVASPPTLLDTLTAASPTLVDTLAAYEQANDGSGKKTSTLFEKDKLFFQQVQQEYQDNCSNHPYVVEQTALGMQFSPPKLEVPKRSSGATYKGNTEELKVDVCVFFCLLTLSFPHFHTTQKLFIFIA